MPTSRRKAWPEPRRAASSAITAATRPIVGPREPAPSIAITTGTAETASSVRRDRVRASAISTIRISSVSPIDRAKPIGFTCWEIVKRFAFASVAPPDTSSQTPYSDVSTPPIAYRPMNSRRLRG